MTFKFKVAAAAVAFLAIGAAQAQKAPEPDFTIAYNVGAVSQYRFRGIEQTSGAPALQAGVDFAHKNGFYAGAWTSNVTWIQDVNGANSGEREVDYFLGFKTSLSGVGVDVGYIRYSFPGNTSGALGTPGFGSFSNADTSETYLGLGYGIFNFKYSQSVGDFLGNIKSGGSKYYDLSLNFDLGNGFVLVPHVGRQTVSNVANNAADYNDYALTLNKDFGNGWSASIAAVGTNATEGGPYSTVPQLNPGKVNRFLGSSAGVLGVKYTF